LKKSISFQYQAHYSLSHEPNFKEKDIWLVLHGYGQLAEFFIRKFGELDSAERLFVAPEGTNYTYLKGFEGRIGANWMTRHERETAIANNHRFLDQLMEHLLRDFSAVPRVHVLGFSQGGATATRWASRWSGRVETLVLWAGGFAQDMALDVAREKFSQTKLISVLGNQDELITRESIEIQEEMIEKLDLSVEKLNFEGGHELESKLLKEIIVPNA